MAVLICSKLTRGTVEQWWRTCVKYAHLRNCIDQILECSRREDRISRPGYRTAKLKKTIVEKLRERVLLDSRAREFQRFHRVRSSKRTARSEQTESRLIVILIRTSVDRPFGVVGEFLLPKKKFPCCSGGNRDESWGGTTGQGRGASLVPVPSVN